jgi:hypothetical protein
MLDDRPRGAVLALTFVQSERFADVKDSALGWLRQELGTAAQATNRR